MRRGLFQKYFFLQQKLKNQQTAIPFPFSYNNNMSSNLVDIHLKFVQFQLMFFGTHPGLQLGKKQHTGKKPQATTNASATTAGESDETKLNLTNAEIGKVVVRFPPEASGFLHIGHAKAALVNFMLKQRYQGKMILRFDDTNPDKEKTDFEKIVIEDLHSLGVTWDMGPTFSSDLFDLMIEKAEELIKKGLAYCDRISVEEMRRNRFDGIASEDRSNTVEQNWQLWQEMKTGSEAGQKICLRAKMSVDAENKALRDPTLYRVVLTPHPRQGTKYKVYPIYDFCCPIVDSVEGVTHALRTNEYHDRNDQYYWILDALQMRKPIIEDFSRLNMEYSLMSKRKLTRCVNEKVVDGWDDPRFPTVRALMRRGLNLEALKEFVKVQGMSKAVNFMEWHKIWNFNLQILDPSVPRYSCVAAGEAMTKCKVMGQGAPDKLTISERPKHKKNASLGTRKYYQGPVIYLDAEDVALLKEGEEVTLMDWGNCFVKNIKVKDEKTKLPAECELHLNLDGDFKKTKYKLTWVAESNENVKLVLHEYDHLLLKKKPDPEDELESILNRNSHFSQDCIGEFAMTDLKKGDCLQLERRGFYKVDALSKEKMDLIYIPDGRDKMNHLAAKVQYLKKTDPNFSLHPTANEGKKEGEVESMTLEEKKAAKAAKKAASGKK